MNPESSAENYSVEPTAGSSGHGVGTENNSAANAVNSLVGAYELVQLIGQGGMGQVWLAEQHHPVRRRVAVKLIKAGMDTREVVARFDSERQALALMDHPAIARVFDAGETAQGRPYFVMEYVAGRPITEYCDQKKLTISQRVQLFILVCEGVQHAHQKANNRLTLATKSELAQYIRVQGHPAEAEQSLRVTLAAQQKVLGPDDPDTIATMDRLAYALTNEAHQAEAEDLFRKTLEVERHALPIDAPETLSTLNELAETLTAQGHYENAEQIYSELIAAQRRSLGADHPSTLLSMEHAAENLSEEGRYPEAEKLESEVIAAQSRVLGPDHPQTLRTEMFLALTLTKEGHYAEADKLQTQVIATKRRILGPSSTSTLQSMELEAICLGREERYAESDQMFHQVIDIAGSTHQPATVDEAWYNFATAEAARGNRDQAFADLGRAVQNGLVSPGYLSADTELQSLHGDPPFDAAVARARAATHSGTK